jgi:multidrug efflux system membrane fusion protein
VQSSAFFRVLCGVVCLLSLAACRKGNAAQANGGSGAKGGGRPAVTIHVAPVQRTDAPITVVGSGVVEPTQTVNVEAQTSGAVLEVAFRQGEWVNAGQVLFRLDDRSLRAAVEQARAVLARDEAQAAASRHDAERYSILADSGYVTRSQAEQMRATALANAATVVADRASLAAAQVNLGYATIRAPISGRTGTINIRRGNLVGPSSGPLVVINQLRPIDVRFPVLAQDFELLRAAVAHGPLPVTATSSDSSVVTEHGTLSFLDNAIDSLTGSVTGRASFQNLRGRLWPGQLVFVQVEAGVQTGVLAVPTIAIQTGQQGAFVYVVDPQKKTAQVRSVAAGRAVGDLTIVANGLRVGEEVATDGASRLTPGARVTIAPNAPNGGGLGDTTRGTTVAGALGGEVSTTPGANAATGGAPGSAGGAGGRPNGMAAGGAAGVPNGSRAGAVGPAGAPGTVGTAAGAAPTTGTGTGPGITGGRATAGAGTSAAPSAVAPATPSAPGAGGTVSPAGVARPGSTAPTTTPNARPTTTTTPATPATTGRGRP